MDNQSNVAVDPHGPEILVFRLIKFVKTHSGIGGVDLQIKGRRLDRLLLVTGQTA
jgi:hypothetical protein